MTVSRALIFVPFVFSLFFLPPANGAGLLAQAISGDEYKLAADHKRMLAGEIELAWP